MKTLIFFVVAFATLILANPAPAKPAKPITFTFDCSKPNGKGAKETCDTMCYGLKCRKIQNSFTWDAPAKNKENSRRLKAGCGKNNRCSKKPYGKGFQCDEFPFASTSQADRIDQINRCVPASDNNSQGGQLNKLYNNKEYCNKKKGCQFKLSFKNQGTFKYCKPRSGCKSDGNIYTKSGPVKRDLEVATEPEPQEEGGYYKLASGETIYSPSDLEIGTLSVRAVPQNGTEEGDLDARAVFDEEYDDFELVEDEVVEKL